MTIFFASPTVYLLIELTNYQLRQWQSVKLTLLAAQASPDELAYCQAKIDQLLRELAQLSDWRT